MTTIIAGDVIIKGDLKNYEFTSEEVIFQIYIRQALDPHSSIEIRMPKPSDAMVSGIKNVGIHNLKNNGIIDFNNVNVSIVSDNDKKDRKQSFNAPSGPGAFI